MGIDYAAINQALQKAGGKPKPEPRSRIKRRARREEATVVREVRRAVFARDGLCRAAWSNVAVEPLTGGLVLQDFGRCRGPLTLAHLLRRSATRGRPPRERHTVDQCVVLCSHHHEMEERHTLRWEYLTDAKADGPMAWRLARKEEA